MKNTMSSPNVLIGDPRLKNAGMTLMCLLFLGLCASRPLDAREKTYTEQLRRDVVRSTTNLVSAPAEVLTTVQKYHREPGPRVFREMAGFVDGVFRVITRFGSGAWDAFAAFIPGMQDGLPPDPEALS